MIPFFAVLIAALVCAGPAHAGFLVPFVAVAFGGGAIATAAAYILVGAGASLVQRALQDKQKPQGPGAISIDAPTSGDGTPQTIILGRRAVAGHRTCPEYSRGNGKEWLTIVRDLSDMPVNGLTAMWIGNERVTLGDGPGGVGGALADFGVDNEGWLRPETGKYVGKVRVRFYDGTQTAADPHLLAEYGSHPDRPWQADMRLLGVAYVIVELKRDQELFPGIPDLLFEVEGAKLYDPRNGQITWSNNLALMAYNVMRGIQMPDGSIFGGGLDDADLPLSIWAPAINEAGAQNWRGGLEISVGPQDYDGDLPYEVVEHLLQGCAGQVAEGGGVWRVRIGGPGLPVASVTDRDVVISENQVFIPHQGPREVYNGVTGQYAETAERWESKTTPLRIDPAYVARDGARNVVHLTYHAVTDGEQCQKLTQMALDDNRRQRILELALPLDYAPVEVLDTLSFTMPVDGFVSKLVEITAKTTDPVTMGQRVFVREVDPNDYTPPAVTPLPTAPVVTTPLAPQPLPGWAVEPVIVQDAEGRNRRPGVRIMWTPLPAEGIEWELRSQGATELAGEGTTQEVEKGQRVITAGLINGTAMQIRGRAVLRNRARAWTAWTNFIVPNVGLGPNDMDIEAVRADVLADLTILEEWLDGGDGPLQPLRDGVTQAQADLADARVELAADISAAEQLAMDNLNIARAYTDTGLQSESVARNALGQSLAAQIQTLTAALTSDNLLDNALFASGLDGWTVSGFITVQVRDTASSDPIFANAPTANFARIIPPSSGTRMMRQDFPVEFAANEVFQWRLKAASAAAGRAATLRVNWFNASDAQIGGNVDTALSLVQNEWRTFSAQHTPPTGAVSMRWQFMVPGSGAEPTYLAEPAVTRVDQSTLARITGLEVVAAELDAAFALFKSIAEARLDGNEAAITTEGSTRATQFGSLSGQISTVSALANGRNRTFRQNTAPSGPVAGDVWYDTANGNLPKRWSGTAWVNTDDARIAQTAAAVTNEQIARANAVLSLASQLSIVSASASRLRTFRGSETPVGAELGDLWYKSDEGNRLYRYSGPPNNLVWSPVDDTRIAENSARITNETIARVDALLSLASQLNIVSAAANRTRTFIGSETPVGAQQGDLWYKADEGNRLYRLSGPLNNLVWAPTDDARIAQNAADITTEAAARATADSAQAQLINTVSARTDRGTANGLLRVSAEATPAGVTSRIGLRAEATAGATAQSAALFLEATADGSQVVIAADRVSIATANFPGASRRVPFVVRNGAVFMGNAIVDTLSIGPNQVTVPAAQQLASILPGNGTWRNANTISYTLPFPGSAAISWFGSQGYVVRQSQAIGIRLRINGVVQWQRIAGDPNGGFTIEQDWLTMGWRRDLPAGTHSIQVDWWSNNANLQLEDRTLIVQGAMR
ncbi:phage tail protein [Paracoccus hibiscisoli]|uniref:phage tail protein n=1 Tax=Paracoccus hibiscisoli TaxID=2023261 RepID=UPI0023F0C529|nr:phage tail protein [Paracoccus hibiscisoli]